MLHIHFVKTSCLFTVNLLVHSTNVRGVEGVFLRPESNLQAKEAVINRTHQPEELVGPLLGGIQINWTWNYKNYSTIQLH